MRGLLARLDAADRGALGNWSRRYHASTVVHRRTWQAITHAGGGVATISSVVLPLILPPWPRTVTGRVALGLAISHLLVQALKRTIGRPRPEGLAAIRVPDRFSFPSGHACAVLAVALGYSLVFPAAAVPLIALAMAVGWSRVVLGVHYPGDVIAGQLIAIGTVLALL